MNVHAAITLYLADKKKFKTGSGNKAAPNFVGGHRKIRKVLNNVRKWLKKTDITSMRRLND